MSRHFIFIGLGNPGPRFVGTRHNFGREVLEAWAEVHSADFTNITVLCPDTMMNNSGAVVADFVHQHNVVLEDMLVIHDDLELPLGAVLRSAGGSAKGHNGVRSIQKALGTLDIPRLRLGIGRSAEGVSVHDFVLEKFTAAEVPLVAIARAEAVALLSVVAQDN